MLFFSVSFAFLRSLLVIELLVNYRKLDYTYLFESLGTIQHYRIGPSRCSKQYIAALFYGMLILPTGACWPGLCTMYFHPLPAVWVSSLLYCDLSPYYYAYEIIPYRDERMIRFWNKLRTYPA